MHGFHGFAGVGAFEHQHNATHGFAFAIFGHGSIANCLPKAHLSHLPQLDRQTFSKANHYLFELIRIFKQSLRTNVIRTRSFFYVAATSIGIALLHRYKHILYG